MVVDVDGTVVKRRRGGIAGGGRRLGDAVVKNESKERHEKTAEMIEHPGHGGMEWFRPSKQISSCSPSSAWPCGPWLAHRRA